MKSIKLENVPSFDDKSELRSSVYRTNISRATVCIVAATNILLWNLQCQEPSVDQEKRKYFKTRIRDATSRVYSRLSQIADSANFKEKLFAGKANC